MKTTKRAETKRTAKAAAVAAIAQTQSDEDYTRRIHAEQGLDEDTSNPFYQAMLDDALRLLGRR